MPSNRVIAVENLLGSDMTALLVNAVAIAGPRADRALR